MKQKLIKRLHDIEAADYAFNECEKYGIDPIDNAENFADSYEDGYKACWDYITSPLHYADDDPQKMPKDLANEFACMAFYALGELVNNGNINPLSQKLVFKRAMEALREFYISPL